MSGEQLHTGEGDFRNGTPEWQVESDRDRYFPLAFIHRDKPALPADLRPLYNVGVASSEEAAYVRSIQPSEVDAVYTLVSELEPQTI